MTSQERKEITDFEKCDFALIHEYYKQRAEEKKQTSKEEKQVRFNTCITLVHSTTYQFCLPWKKIKEDNEKLQQEYGTCIIDGHKEKIGNWKIEPPGLFRGRGDHPKMGRLKARFQPCDPVVVSLSQYVICGG